MKYLKKIYLLILSIVIFSNVCFLSGCGVYKGKISNNNLKGFNETGLSFFVDKNAAYKDTVLDAVNQAINELGHEKIAELIEFHNKKLDGKDAELSFDIPDTSNLNGGVLVVYSSCDGPPFDYLGASNLVAGVEIDILKFAALKLNRKIETRVCTFGAITQNLLQNSSEWRISGVGAAITEERKQKVAFTDSFWTMKLNIISKATDNFSTVEELSGKRIGVYTGESGSNYMHQCYDEKRLNKKTKIVEYTTPQTAFQGFLTGKVDAVVCLDYVADGLIRNR